MKLFRPITLLICFLSIFCGVLGFGWLQQGPSDQELLANYSKALDYWHGIVAVHGWPWWTPNFMGGHSLAPSTGAWLSFFWILIGSSFAGPVDGSKIVGLLCIAVSGLTTYGFAKKFTRSGWIGLYCAIFYVTCPQFSLRLAGTEHIVVAMCFPYPPLILWALTLVAEKASWRNCVLFAMAFGGMLLTFAKLAVLFTPVIAAFWLWLFFARRACRANLRAFIARSTGPVFVLGILPLLPALREIPWMTMFTRDPLDAWQHRFSMKTALSWFDRGNGLMAGMPATFTADQGGFYLGAVAILSLAIFLLWRRADSLETSLGRKCRAFIGIGLLLHWLSFGPRSVIGGHLEFLRAAQGAQYWVLAIFWFALFAQIWIIIRLWPECRCRILWIAGFLAVYLCVPGFLLIQWIPGFDEIRAPWSYWQVGESFCFSMAAGLALGSSLHTAFTSGTPRFFSSKFSRAVPVAFLLLIGLADLSVYHALFLKKGLPEETFSDFRKAEDFLRLARLPGRVYPISRRYFYLMTPDFSGRPIMREAFNSYYMERWTRMADDAGQSAPNLLKQFYNVNGVSHILIDKQDPETPPAFQKRFSDLFKTVYENPHFAVLENGDSLAPAFLAREYIAMPPESDLLAAPMLAYGQYHILPVEAPDDGSKECVGGLDASGNIRIKPDYQGQGAPMFQRLAMDQTEWQALRKNFQRINLPPIDKQGGWLVIAESYHPDWKAYAGDTPIPVRRAMGSLLAIQLPAKPAPLHLEFEPPWWYSASADIALTGWLVCGLLLVVGASGPEKWRRQWTSAAKSPAI